MGLGRYRDGRFDLIVVANYLMPTEDWVAWERSFKKASEILFDASEGQMQFGRLYVCDENIGAGTADCILHSRDGVSNSPLGGFGSPGSGPNLMASIKRDSLLIVHELAHYFWGLCDEYKSGSAFDIVIDPTRPVEGGVVVPILFSGRADNELAEAGARAIFTVIYPDDWILTERTVVADTATTITVDSALPDEPLGELSVYFPGCCAEDRTANFCIMEACHRDRGAFDETGVWRDIPNPLTEFCTPSTHDGDTICAQPCWERILERAGFEMLTMPDSAESGPVTGWTEPEWIVLDKQPRFALVLDRSYSMTQGDKMTYARFGAMLWLQYAHVSAPDDLLTIIWYDHEIGSLLDLTEVGRLTELEVREKREDIAALEPRGSTDIRDALLAALDQIQSRPTRAAVQAALLLTDGKHNTPWGSRAAEVIPDFQEAGVQIHTLGVGDPDAVDMVVLEELAESTGGSSQAAGDDLAVLEAMAEINEIVRGGIITTAPALFPALRMASRSRLTEPAAKGVNRDGRPDWRNLLKLLKIKGMGQVLRPPQRLRSRIMAFPVMVEDHCQRASFTLVYPEGQDLWLYLIDPAGQPVDMGAAGVRHGSSQAPYEFALVQKPKPGRWHMVAVRPDGGASFTFRAIAGGKNPQLHVWGGASGGKDGQAPVRLWASASWGQTLSNLQVTALVTTPKGVKRRLLLTDCRGEERDAGMYEAYYTPEQPGRYTGVIEIVNLGNARLPRSDYLITHTTERHVSLKTAAPQFVRQVPFVLLYGEQPDIRDIEQAQGLTAKYREFRPRPTKLESARVGPKGRQPKV